MLRGILKNPVRSTVASLLVSVAQSGAEQLDITSPVIETFTIDGPTGTDYPVTLGVNESQSLPLTAYFGAYLTAGTALTDQEVIDGTGLGFGSVSTSVGLEDSPISLGDLAPGDYTVKVVVVDGAGNPASATATITVAPSLTLVYSNRELDGSFAAGQGRTNVSFFPAAGTYLLVISCLENGTAQQSDLTPTGTSITATSLARTVSPNSNITQEFWHIDCTGAGEVTLTNDAAADAAGITEYTLFEAEGLSNNPADFTLTSVEGGTADTPTLDAGTISAGTVVLSSMVISAGDPTGTSWSGSVSDADEIYDDDLLPFTDRRIAFAATTAPGGTFTATATRDGSPGSHNFILSVLQLGAA